MAACLRGAGLLCSVPMFFVLVVLLAVLVIPAFPAIVSAMIAAALRATRLAGAAPWFSLAIATALPSAAFTAWALACAWPWPWQQPEAMHDGLGDGFLLLAAGPAWLLCFATSRLVLGRRRRR
jgi:hypothetical protein